MTLVGVIVGFVVGLVVGVSLATETAANNEAKLPAILEDSGATFPRAWNGAGDAYRDYVAEGARLTRRPNAPDLGA